MTNNKRRYDRLVFDPDLEDAAGLFGMVLIIAAIVGLLGLFQ